MLTVNPKPDTSKTLSGVRAWPNTLRWLAEFDRARRHGYSESHAAVVADHGRLKSVDGVIVSTAELQPTGRAACEAGS